MTKKDPHRLSPGPTHQEIIGLGEKLAETSHFEGQKQALFEFIKRYFGGQVYIWLNHPPKSLVSQFSQEEFPFEPTIKITGNNKQGERYQVIDIGYEFWIVLPLLRGENEFGKIILKRSEALNDQALETLTDISTVASLALFATLQTHLQNWRQKQLTLVRSVTTQISQITDLELLTDQITSLIQQTFNYYYVAVFLIDKETEKLFFKSSAGSDESERPDFENPSHGGFALGEHMIGHVALTGQELTANDISQEPRYKEVDSLADTRSEIVIPLKIEARTLGVLDVQSDNPFAFDEDDLVVLRALANNIAIAIENTRLFQDLQNRADQLATVSEVSRAITTILDIDQLLQKIVSLIHERFGFPFVHIYTVDPVHDQITFRAGSGARTPIYTQAEVSFDLDAEKGVVSWVAQHGQTKRVNDIKNEPLFIPSPYAQEPAGSELALPLYFAGEIQGVLDIQSDQINAFSLEDQQLMETLADNIAIAIRNARLYRSERWRRQVSESLRDVAGLLSENSALDDVLDAILVQLHKSLPCDIAGIWLFNSESTQDTPLKERELYLSAYKSVADYPSEEFGQITITPHSWIEKALTQRRPIVRQTQDEKGPIAQRFNMPQDYSAIAVPLHTGDEIFGMLTLAHHTSNRYGSETQNITSAFASYAAIAIENTRLYASSQEQAWISTILLQVTQATQSLTNLDELVATIVRLTPMIVGVKGCGFFLREPESEVFSLYALYGIGDSSEDLTIDLPMPLLDAPILNELRITKEPLRVRYPQDDFNLPEPFSSQMAKDQLILIPMISRDELLGAFLLANEAQTNTQNDTDELFTEERLKIIHGIIQQTAIAVENIRLLEEKQEEAYISTVLLQAAQAAVSTAELEDTLESMVQIMPILVGIDSSIIYLWNEKENGFIASHVVTKNDGSEEELRGMNYSPNEFPMLETVFNNNRPIVYPFVETPLPPEDWDLALPDEGQIDPTPVLKSRYPLLMGFPLSVKDEVFGVLLAQDKNFSTNRERRFELLWGIAQQASLAIQNDILNKEMLERQRLEREFQLAREIQQTFLPDQMPEMPGWQMDVHWETARQVGGDFYDYFLLPDGRLAFVIADVSDKGLAASLYMTVTRTLLRAAALEYQSPAKTLERVNDLLLANSQDGLFVTTFYGVLSLDDGTLTYTIAGHNPPMVVRYQENQVLDFSMGGIALGAMPDIHLPEKEIILNSGDCLFLYTDGVTEAFNFQDQMYGEDRLKRVLKTTIGENAIDVVKSIEADLTAFRGNAPLSDDTTFLAICRSRSLANQNGNGRSS